VAKDLATVIKIKQQLMSKFDARDLGERLPCSLV
jgi:hypothetical protein